MPQIPYYLNNPIKLSTYPKQEQQAVHQHKQLISHKQKKALRAMALRTGYPGKQSAEEVRKEQVTEQKISSNGKGISRKKKKQPPNSANDH
jgi:hypothetical protein